jgi:hypothetical protein
MIGLVRVPHEILASQEWFQITHIVVSIDVNSDDVGLAPNVYTSVYSHLLSLTLLPGSICVLSALSAIFRQEMAKWMMPSFFNPSSRETDMSIYPGAIPGQ